MSIVGVILKKDSKFEWCRKRWIWKSKIKKREMMNFLKGPICQKNKKNKNKSNTKA